MNNPTIAVPGPVPGTTCSSNFHTSSCPTCGAVAGAQNAVDKARIEQLEQDGVEYRRKLEIAERTSEIVAQWFHGCVPTVLHLGFSVADVQNDAHKQATDEWNATHPAVSA